MFFKKKRKQSAPFLQPSEFLRDVILILHDNAAKKGFAKKGFIFNEGLLELGNPIILEALKSQPDLNQRDTSFYFSLAASSMQIGFVLARQLCIDKTSLIDGSFLESHPTPDTMYQELIIGLKADLNVDVKQWEAFRRYIVLFFTDLISPYLGSPHQEVYNMKLLVAYYMLGVSIGLEKYEP